MMDIFKISATAKAYPWGGLSFIQDLVKEQTSTPIGELWMGTHPNGPSMVLDPSNGLLQDRLHAYPALLGNRAELPFLMKVMAIERPLSIQCHPDAQQARTGWERERAIGGHIPNDQRNYQDPNPKEEMVVALGPLTVMCGLRPTKEMHQSLLRLLPHSFKTIFDRTTPSLKEVIRTLGALDALTFRRLIKEYQLSLEAMEEEYTHPFLSRREIALRLIDLHGFDPWVFAPFLLQVLHAEPGQGIYLKPGILHAYVQGHGIELMTNSDNILRAGLTDKHIDGDELFAMMDHSTQPTEFLRPLSAGGRSEYRTPSTEFSLICYGDGVYQEVGGRPSIFFCVEGQAQVTAHGCETTINRGESLFMGATVSAYQLSTHGTVFCATTPR